MAFGRSPVKCFYNDGTKVHYGFFFMTEKEVKLIGEFNYIKASINLNRMWYYGFFYYSDDITSHNIKYEIVPISSNVFKYKKTEKIETIDISIDEMNDNKVNENDLTTIDLNKTDSKENIIEVNSNEVKEEPISKTWYETAFSYIGFGK